MRVLVVRIGAMGDVLHALPAVEALHRRLPDSYIGWAIEPRWRTLLREGALIDRIHPVPTAAWKQRPVSVQTIGETVDLRRELREERYDVCVDLQGSIRSAAVGFLAGAGRFVGSETPREGPARWGYGERVEVTGRHVIEQGCELMSRAVGLELRPAPVHLPEFPAEAEALRETLRRMGDIDNVQYAVLVPTAGWGAKQWPAERFREVAIRLKEQGLRAIVNAATTEDEVAKEVARDGVATVVACDLRGLTELMRGATVVIGGDSGPVHLAAALGRPAVALFGPTDPVRTGPQAFPGSRVRVLRDVTSTTSHKRLVETEAGLRRITVEMVMEAMREVLVDDGETVAEGFMGQRLAKRVRVPLGFVTAALFLWFAHPDARSLGLSAVPVFAGLLLRGYASGYVRKNTELTTSGPYAYTRNPLYLGSLLMVLGFALASASAWLGVALTAVFALIYIPTIQGEEAYLRGRFAEFGGYATRVPRLVPRLRTGGAEGGTQAAGRFSGALYRQHREYNASMGVGALYVVLILRVVLDRQAFLPALYRSR